ncbi:hypothetical protein J7E29_16660 [Streptomyces sp. ISL-90]|nr:hypothetical protein [Streptomyces sp. ISL-90]
MKLLAIPDATGKPLLWINAKHLVSVARLHLQTGREVILVAELKVDGMPLQRVELGTFGSLEETDAPWATFLERLQA